MGWFDKKDQWRRQPGEIAIRIEGSDVKRSFGNRPFVVYDGTVALVFQQGKLLGELNAGKHDVDGRIRNWFVGDYPTVLIITDDGEFTLDVNITGLYSLENIGVDANLRVTLRVDKPEAFYLNAMKDHKKYLVDDLREHLRPELHDALVAYTGTRPVGDLYHNPTMRQEASDILRERMGSSLASLGFKMVELAVTQFSSEIDVVRDKQGAAVVEAARIEVLKKVREGMADDRRHEAVTQAQLDDAVRQASHELGLKDRLRQDEMDKLNARLKHDALDFEQERTQERVAARIDDELDMDARKRGHARTQSELDTESAQKQHIMEGETTGRLRDIEREGDENDLDLAIKARDAALEGRRRKRMDDVEIERERAKTLADADTATKIALGAGDKEALLELERLEQKKNMTPDQLLVLAAEKSEAAAAALAERFRSEGKINENLVDQLRRQIEDGRQTNREHADRLERVLRESLQRMGDVAKAKAESQGAGDQTIVTGGGLLGGPTVVNPNKPNEQDEERKD